MPGCLPDEVLSVCISLTLCQIRLFLFFSNGRKTRVKMNTQYKSYTKRMFLPVRDPDQMCIAVWGRSSSNTHRTTASQMPSGSLHKVQSLTLKDSSRAQGARKASKSLQKETSTPRSKAFAASLLLQFWDPLCHDKPRTSAVQTMYLSHELKPELPSN